MTFIDSLNGLQNPYRLAIAYGLIALMAISLLVLLYRYRRSFAWYRNISAYYHGRRLRIMQRRGRQLYLYSWEVQDGDHSTGLYHPPSPRWMEKYGPALNARVVINENLRAPLQAQEPDRQDEPGAEPEEERTEENIYRLAANQ